MPKTSATAGVRSKVAELSLRLRSRTLGLPGHVHTFCHSFISDALTKGLAWYATGWGTWTRR